MLGLFVVGACNTDDVDVPASADAVVDTQADVSGHGDGTATDVVNVDAGDDEEDVVYTGLPPEPWRTTHDFIVTEMFFHVPDGLAPSTETVPNPCGLDGFTDNTSYEPLLLDGLIVDGFDLDGEDGSADEVCPHTDYVSPSGVAGVDVGFLHVMDMIRPARPGQTIEVVLASAPAQGLVRIGIRLRGVDAIDNDPEVEMVVTTTLDTPILGADGEILAGGSVEADPNPAYQSVVPGEIVDGVLYAGPADIVIGGINLLVVEDRVVRLRDARVRATLSQRDNGLYDVEAIVGGWWQREDMVEAIGSAIQTIGANAGELECVLDSYSDHSTDGVNCDAMSTMLSMKLVSGFITGLEQPESDAGEGEAKR